MNSEFLATRAGMAVGKFQQVITDTPAAIRVFNKAGLAVTSVTTTTATNIVLIDSAGTTTLAFATYDTVAKLAAAINNTTSWGCKVLDALYADATASVFVDGAITAAVRPNGVTVWDVLVDTSAAKTFTFCATVDREVGTDNVSRTKLHRVQVRKANYKITLGAAAADKAQIWTRTIAGNNEVKGVSVLSVSATDTAFVDYSSTGTKPFLVAPEGTEVLFRVTDGTSIADSTANFLKCDYIVE